MPKCGDAVLGEIMNNMSVAELFRASIGEDAVLQDYERLPEYGADKSRVGTFPPDVVLLPESEEQVSAILRLAQEHKIPVTPRGGGTGLTGGAVPVSGGAVLSMERMANIISIDADARMATVQPGVVTSTFIEELDKVGLFYPPAPNSWSSTIGGNLFHNSGGPRSYKYGSILDYVTGARIALMGGQVIEVGNRANRGYAGYNMMGLMTGSEGTLGIATEITLCVRKQPEARKTVVLEAASAQQAVAAVSAIANAGVDVSAVDLIGKTCSSLVSAKGKFSFRTDDPWVILIETDGEEEAIGRRLSDVLGVVEGLGIPEVYPIHDEADVQAIWEDRRNMFLYLSEEYPGLIVEDIGVPVAKLDSLVDHLERLSAERNLRWAAIGNIGEGNLHIGCLQRDASPEARDNAKGLFAEMLTWVTDSGGEISFEHGISFKKRDIYSKFTDPKLVELQAAIKAVFDPEGLLNPGKIFKGSTEE